MVPTAETWQEELELALQSAPFARARQAKRLLSWLVAQVVSGDISLLNEYDVALHVFHRADHDPAADAHIRKQMSRLRVRLANYYADEGQFRPFEIRIHCFTPDLVWVARQEPTESADLVLLQPFEPGSSDLTTVASRLTDEVAHMLSSRRKLQLGAKTRPSQRRVVLTGSVWQEERSSEYLVFARTANELGIVLRSLRLTHQAGLAWDACASAIIDGLFSQMLSTSA